MEREEFIQLAKKISQGTATEKEIRLYSDWFDTYSAGVDVEITNEPAEQLHKQELLENIQAEIDQLNRRKIKILPRIAAAASILVACSIGLYFGLQYIQQQTPKIDIPPAHNQAVLTLANGQKIVLTKGLSGKLAQQGNTAISANGQDIVYNASNKEDQVSYNTLTTARGEQSPYPLVLADGTKVWLNAQSSIVFPTVFNGKERVVKLIGEAYFEVKHNAGQPFKVQTEKQTIEDIGTSFDVNAYADEGNTKTTLVEGSVKVNNKLLLTPNEQTDGNSIQIVDTRRFIAWKNGDFDFEDENIKDIMRELARWYNIDVKYEGNITNARLSAQITRNRNISSVLNMLENTKVVHFKIEERRVTVIE